MAISVSIETLEDGEEFGGPWSTDSERRPHSFVEEMNSQGGVFLGTDIFIPLGRITSLWFSDVEESDDETEG